MDDKNALTFPFHNNYYSPIISIGIVIMGKANKLYGKWRLQRLHVFGRPQSATVQSRSANATFAEEVFVASKLLAMRKIMRRIR
jgi:hypothetical protein